MWTLKGATGRCNTGLTIWAVAGGVCTCMVLCCHDYKLLRQETHYFGLGDTVIAFSAASAKASVL